MKVSVGVLGARQGYPSSPDGRGNLSARINDQAKLGTMVSARDPAPAHRNIPCKLATLWDT